MLEIGYISQMGKHITHDIDNGIGTTLTFGTILDSQRKVNHILDTATIFRQRHSFLLSIILHVVKLYFKNSKSNKE